MTRRLTLSDVHSFDVCRQSFNRDKKVFHQCWFLFKDGRSMYTPLSHDDIHKLLHAGLTKSTSLFDQFATYAYSFFYQPEDNVWNNNAKIKHFQVADPNQLRTTQEIMHSLFR